MTRYADVIRVPADKIEEYKAVHDHIWPQIEEKMRNVNISNFTIFFRDGYLFKYYEYTGNDFETDMKKLEKDAEHDKWLEYTARFQIPVDTAAQGEWWAPMREVYHLSDK